MATARWITAISVLIAPALSGCSSAIKPQISGPPVAIAFKCPSGTRTDTRVEGRSGYFSSTWRGSVSNDPVLCVWTGSRQPFVYGLAPLPTGSGAKEMRAALEAIMAGDKEEHCYRSANAPTLEAPSPSVFDNCLRQLGTSDMVMDGVPTKYMLLQWNSTEVPFNRLSRDDTYYLDIDHNMWVRDDALAGRGLTTAWTREIER